jgi:hypothetical protein
LSLKAPAGKRGSVFIVEKPLFATKISLLGEKDKLNCNVLQE